MVFRLSSHRKFRENLHDLSGYFTYLYGLGFSSSFILFFIPHPLNSLISKICHDMEKGTQFCFSNCVFFRIVAEHISGVNR